MIKKVVILFISCLFMGNLCSAAFNVTGVYTNPTTLPIPNDVDVQGDYAYVGSGSSFGIFTVLNISNKSSPSFVNYTILGSVLDVTTGIEVDGGYAYATGYFSDSLVILDVSNPYNTFFIGGISDNINLDGPTDVAVSGNAVFVTNYNGLTLVSAEVKITPLVVSNIKSDPIMSLPSGVDVQGIYAYVTSPINNSLIIWDYSALTVFLYEGGIIDDTYMDGASDVFVSGDYAYVTGSDSDSLAVVDISNPSNPHIVGGVINSTYMDGASDVFVSGDYVYVTGANSNSLAVVDVSNKSGPFLRYYFDINPADVNTPSGLIVKEDYVYVTGYSSNSLAIINYTSDVPPYDEIFPGIVLSDQGTEVKDDSGKLLESGVLIIEIYDSPVGGNLVYSESFADAIKNGEWNVMLGENFPLELEHGKIYYKDYRINGNDVDFTNGTGDIVERHFFYSYYGGMDNFDIDNATDLTIGSSITFAFGEMIDNLVDGWLRITGNLNVTDGARFRGDVNFSRGFSEGGITVSDGDIYADKLYVYDINSLSVQTIQITNDSFLPSLDSQFDVGNSSLRWREGYFSELNITGKKPCLEDGTDCVPYIVDGEWDNTSEQVYLKESSSQYLNVSDVLFVNGTSGNVGIRVNPQENLHVKGGILQEILLDGTFGFVSDSKINDSRGIFVSEDYVYATSFELDSLVIIDVSNKSDPFVVGDVSDERINGAGGVYVIGDYAYVTGYESDSLAVIDVSNKSDPFVVGDVSDWRINGAIDVFVNGNYAYVIGKDLDSLAVIDVSDPRDIFIISYVIYSYFMARASKLSVSGDYAYVTGYDSNSLAVIDVSDEGKPIVVGGVIDKDYMDGANGIDVHRDYAYVLGENSNSLAVIDVSDSKNPYIMGGLIDEDYMNGAAEVFAYGNYVYVVGSESDSLVVVDVSNKNSPIVLINITNETYLNGASEIYVYEGYIYVIGSESNSLAILELDSYTNLGVLFTESVKTNSLNANDPALFRESINVKGVINAYDLFIENNGSFGSSLFSSKMKIGGEDSIPFVALDVEGDSDVQAKFGDNLSIYLSQNPPKVGFNVHDGIFGHNSLDNYASSIEEDTLKGRLFFKTSSNSGNFSNVSVMENRMVLDREGNLGIGKNPIVKLDVDGNVNISGELYVGGGFYFEGQLNPLGDLEDRNFNQNYTALHDGFVIAHTSADFNSRSDIVCYINGERKAFASANVLGGGVNIVTNSFTVPVKKNDTWRVEETIVMGTSVSSVRFRNIGN